MERVGGYDKVVNGRRVHVHGYERKSRDHLSAHDRKVNRRNVRKAEKSRRHRR